MAGTHRPHVSSDKTMSKWPVNINPLEDRITPYPCQTCHKPFHSCKALATHKCEGGRRIVATPPVETITLAEAVAEVQKREHDRIIEIVNEMREAS